MNSRASFFLRGTLWMICLYHGGADNLQTHDIGNVGNGDFQMTNSYDATTTREPCKICSNGANCTFVSTVFSRERMEEGYNFLATIPSGACNVTVRENSKTKNNLALRWTLDKIHYFNGGWMIQQSGNYLAGSNLFTYKHSETFGNSSKSGEYIHFASQLNLRIDVLLIVKEKNPGIKFSYVLPPIKNSQERPNKAEKDHVTEELKPSLDITTSKNTAEEAIVQKKDNQKKQMAVFSNLPNFIRRQAGEGDSLPDWIQDFKSILKEWKRQLDEQGGDIKSLRSSLDAHKTETANSIKSLRSSLDAHKTETANSIKALKTKFENHRACKTGYSNEVHESADPWRSDGRCGPKYPLPNGAPAQCDPNNLPCCSNYAHCGVTSYHCSCSTCIDYSSSTTEKGNTMQIAFGQTFSQVPTVIAAPSIVKLSTSTGKAFFETRVESITASSAEVKIESRNVEKFKVQWMACV